MTRRMIKFPLKMKNGAEVRSLEELRDNADVESIMKYYFSGQLSLWCKAYGYEEISADISETKESFVKSIMNSIGVNASVEEMQEYIQNSFGISDTSGITADVENEEEIIDDSEIKNKLKEYTDVNLDDYEISVIPVENEIGNIDKYRIFVVCEKTEQYYRFVIPFNLNADYSIENFKDDCYRKIAYSISLEQVSNHRNKLKYLRYSTLVIGDALEFGKYNGKVLRWRVARKSDSSIYVVSESVICEMRFDSHLKNEWHRSDIRTWLNNEFYNNTFTEKEKLMILDVDGDKVTLLEKDDIQYEIHHGLIDSYNVPICWYRTPHPSKKECVWDTQNFSYTNRILGVRPVITIKF